MKNYLFAPFKDDEHKIESFNHFKNYLPKGHHSQLVIFVGSLESYYDNIISDIISDNNDLRAEIKELNDKLQSVNDDYNNDHKVHDKYEDALKEEIKELKADISKLEAHVDKYGSIAYDELKAELKKANDNNMKYSSLKEYKAEADMYFHHNPQCKSVLFFMVGSDEFGDGDGGHNGCYNGELYADDSLIEIDNEGSN